MVKVRSASLRWSALCAVLVGACGGEGTEPAGRPGGDSGVQLESSCSLSRARLSFEPTQSRGGKCDQCMQQGCCAVAVACFSSDPNCRALNECILSCETGGGPGGSPTAGDGGVDDVTSCATDCRAKYPGAVETQKEFGLCYQTSCRLACESS